MRVPTCVFPISADLIAALDERLGPPVDSYVNGSQTWLTDDGPGGSTLEWRLHPVSGYRIPNGLGPYDLWDEVAGALAGGQPPTALVLGKETRPLTSLWDGLEVFPAHGDETEPAPLAAASAEVLGMTPPYSGLVDHEVVGDAWERSRGSVSIVALLVEQLTS